MAVSCWVRVRENVVQAGAAHREARDQPPARVGRVEQGPHLRGAAVGRHAQRQAATEADIAAAVAASGLGAGEWMASYPRMLGQLTDPRRFPALTAFTAGVFDAADGPDDEFVFGLDRILDGVGVLTGG